MDDIRTDATGRIVDPSGVDGTITGLIGYGFRDNVNGLELQQWERESFTAEITNLLLGLGATVLFVGAGQGIWEGVREPAGSVTFTLPVDEPYTVWRIGLLIGLKVLARKYNQDSIALTFGETTLVESY